MADGTQVKTIKELREHFDLETVLANYKNGRLKKWLEMRGYTEEAKSISYLSDDQDNSIEKLCEKLCEILGVNCPAGELERIDLDAIVQRNERLERLKRYTADDTILAKVDCVAFTQEELDQIVSYPFTTSPKEIYLCGEQGEPFVIPQDEKDVLYIGVNNPEIRLTGEVLVPGIDFQNVWFNVDCYLGTSEKFELYFRTFQNNPSVGVEFLQASAENGSAIAQAVLSECYVRGFGVEKNDEEAIKWLTKAAERDNADAQDRLGHNYQCGKIVEKKIEEAVKWSLKAAEQGHPKAQTRMGTFYERGEGVEKDIAKAAKWYIRAATQGNAIAQYHLGCCYRDGRGVAKDKNKAIWLLKRAYEGNVKEARTALIEIAPTLFKLSDVILYAAGGKENIVDAKMEKADSVITICVLKRSKVNEAILYHFGASKVQIEKIYHTYEKGENPLENITNANVDVAAAASDVLWTAIMQGMAIAKGTKMIKYDQKKTVQEDREWGVVYIALDITAEMEIDYNNNIKCMEKAGYECGSDMLKIIQEAIPEAKPVPKLHGFVNRRTKAEINGIKGSFVWDHIFTNEITFDSMDGSAFWLFRSMSDAETKTRWDQLVDKYCVKG